MPRRKDLVIWSIPVTRALDKELEIMVREDMHVSKSDLVREAVRDKLQKMRTSLAQSTQSPSDKES